MLISQKNLEKRFGQSPIFIASTFMEEGGLPPSTNPALLLKEAIHVISCGYEDKTEWGKEVSRQDRLFLSLSPNRALLASSRSGSDGASRRVPSCRSGGSMVPLRRIY